MFKLPGGGGVFCKFGFVLPKVVSAVELTPNRTMKTLKSIVKLPHCVKRLSGALAIFNEKSFNFD